MLASTFLDGLNREHGQSKRFSEEVLDRLESHHWPGNVRELRNVVSRAFILADRVLGLETLPAAITGRRQPEGPDLHVRVGTSIAETEKRLVLATLEELGGNKKRAAETLGISVKTLYNRLKAYESDAGAASRPRADGGRREG
jgi:DNA-binding NtrC family response regulator